jgi:hypothetical protein
MNVSSEIEPVIFELSAQTLPKDKDFPRVELLSFASK